MGVLGRRQPTAFANFSSGELACVRARVWFWSAFPPQAIGLDRPSATPAFQPHAHSPALHVRCCIVHLLELPISTHPGRHMGFFAVTQFHVALIPAKTKRNFLTTTRSQPRLGLVEGSRCPTQTHIRGLWLPLGRWAGETAHDMKRFFGGENLAKILSCRIDPPTSLVHGGWHGKGRKKETEPQNTRVRALNR